MTDYVTPTTGDLVWIYERQSNGVARARRATVVRVTKTTFTLDNDKRYLTSRLPLLVRHGSAGNTSTWITGPVEKLLADGDFLIADALRQGANRRAAHRVESAFEPFTKRAVRTGMEIVTPEQIETMIDALRLYQSRARDKDEPAPNVVHLDPTPTPKD